MNMQYKYIDKKSDQTLVLLHGTGGNESDLLFLGELIDPKANLLGLRGRINEHGMNRFFKRLRPGVFDIDNLVEETKYLNKFIKAFAKVNQLDSSKMTLIGFSNGANIIGSHIYHYGNEHQAYVMMHPMIPIEDFDIVDQNNNHIMITAGNNDPMVPLEQAEKLRDLLNDKGANVHFKVYGHGHQLSDAEIKDIKKWVKKNR